MRLQCLLKKPHHGQGHQIQQTGEAFGDKPLQATLLRPETAKLDVTTISCSHYNEMKNREFNIRYDNVKLEFFFLYLGGYTLQPVNR